MESSTSKIFSKTSYGSIGQSPTLMNLKNVVSSDIYRVRKKVNLKDDELPFTNINMKPRKL